MWIILNILFNNTPISEDIIIADNNVSTSELKNGNSQVSPSNYLRIFAINLWFLILFFYKKYSLLKVNHTCWFVSYTVLNI